MYIYIHTYHLVKDQMSQMASTCADLFGGKKKSIYDKISSSCKNWTIPVLLLLWCHGVIVSFRWSQFTSRLFSLLEEELRIVSCVSFRTRESHLSENPRCIKMKFPVSAFDWPGSEHCQDVFCSSHRLNKCLWKETIIFSSRANM